MNLAGRTYLSLLYLNEQVAKQRAADRRPDWALDVRFIDLQIRREITLPDLVSQCCELFL